MTNLVQVEFHGDALWATRQDGEVFVAVKPVCEAMGIGWGGQRQRIQRDAVLSEGASMIHAPSRGGIQEALCLPLRLLNGWLFGIDEQRVKRAEVREKIVRYKRECYEVLFNHFLPRPAPEYAEPEPEVAAQDEWSRWLEVIREGRRVYGQRFARELWERDECPLPRFAGREAALRFDEDGRDPSIEPFLYELPGLVDGPVEAWVRAPKLYQWYRTWCRRGGVPVATPSKFGLDVGRSGVRKKKGYGGIVYAAADLGLSA